MAQRWNEDGAYWYDDEIFDAGGNRLPAPGDWGNWLKTQGVSNAPNYKRLGQYMTDLSKNYGLGEQDFIKGLQSYGVNYQPVEFNNDTMQDVKVPGFGRDPNIGWWGENALIRSLGQGLDKSNPGAAYAGSWRNLWNQNAENAEQNEIANIWQRNQDRYSQSSNFMNDIPTILSGVGMVLGAGALGGAFGGGGLFGGGNFPVGGADWMSEIAAGAGNSGAGLGSAASAAADATWGVNARGGDMSWLDDILNSTQNDAVWNTSGSGNVLDVLGNSANSVNLPNGLNFDEPPTGINSITSPSGGVRQQVLQRMVDQGIPFDAATSAVGNMGPSQLNQLRQLLNSGSQGSQARTGTALSRLLSGSGDNADLLSALGMGATGLLDYLGAQRQNQTIREMYSNAWNAGAPSRARYEAAMAPGFDIRSIPGLSSAMDTATETYLRKLSAQNGNPAGVGGAPSQTQAYVLGNVALPAYQNYVNQQANAGGIGTLSGQSTQAGMNAAMGAAAPFASIGQTIGQMTQPRVNLNALLGGLA